jgi:superfamily II DNA or RNA helicase
MSFVAVGTFDELIRSLDSDPHLRGKQFEKITKWWLQNDPIHSRDVKKVWLWDEWPDRPGRDIGVDLVAEMRDGSLCAIQSKCFDAGRDIPKSELDSFVSAASTRTFKHRWLVASTDGLSANARRMLRDNHVTQILFSYLDSLEGFWPASFDALGGTPTLTKASPRPHQQDAIRDVVEGLSKVSRGQLIMACGTGKTLTALWITEALEPSTTLVLVPSLSLLSQTLSEWAKNANTKWDYLCVCSDETVNKSDDAPISTTDELPFDVTTKPADIAAFLERRGRKIIFSTYQSSAQVAKAQKTAGKKFDLVICDEAHRLTGKNDAEFATALDDSKIPAKKRLFMTATPRTYTASVKAKASERGVEITSMDDETIFGKELHKLSFGQAIEKELLTDYRVVIVGVTDPQVQELIDRRDLVSVAGTVETDARTLAAHIGLAKATKDYDLKRTISFHGRIKAAQEFAQQHAEIVQWMPEDHKPSGTIWADTITGAMNSSDRRKLLNKLKADVPGQHALLSNARCLTEGIDVPSLDGVAFIDPRSSQVDIIQAVGRAIRKANNKTLGTIVLPVLIPHDADTEHALEDSAFKPIWAILNALRSHDEQLATELDQLRTELGRTSKLGVIPNRIVESLPLDIDSLIPDFSNQLSLALVERSTNSWDYMYGQLLDYVEKHGHARPLARKVGRSWFEGWVAQQRTNFNKGLLSSDRIQKLDKLPGWTWDPLGDSWNKFYELTKQFSQEFGHAAVPTKPTLYKGERLAGWINSQRTDYNKGQLDQQRISQLEHITGWTWAPKDDQYERGFNALLQYVLRNKTAKIKRDHIEIFEGKTIRLGSWCQTRRGDYKRGWLTKDQIQSFEDLPDWTWNPIEEAWMNWFQLLVRFGSEHGHFNPPKTYYPVGSKESLASWVNTQRTRYKKSKLEPERILRLESLTGWTWSPFDDAWESAFQKVDQIANTIGSIADYQATDKESKFLKGWINNQRANYFDNSLELERASRLATIPGWSWEKRDVHLQAWQESISYLKSYVESHGRLPSRSSVVDDFKLGEWVKGRRTDYNAGRLSAERITELESISGWTWDPFEDSWREFFNELKSRSETSPIGLPNTFSNKQISTWITRQRKLYKLQKISKSRIAELESLNGWSWLNEELKSDKWTEMYQHLVQFTDQFGHARVRDKSVFNGIKLGTWVAVQRRRYFQKSISNEQIKQLESLARWSWDPIEDDWNDSFVQMQNFALKHPERFPQKQNADEFELAQWLGVQRSAYKAGKISDERIKLLESITGWIWEARNDRIRLDAWNESYAALQKHLARGGTLKIAKNVRVDGIALSSWVSIQRKMFQSSKLSKSQIEDLESLPGWAWDVFEESWELRFQKVLQFANREKHALVTQRTIEDGVDIGTWVNTQRNNYRDGKLVSERITRLENIPGWVWEVKDTSWDDNYELLKTYATTFGHARVPDHYKIENVALGKWVGKQRQKYKKGTLIQSRIEALEFLNGWMWAVK